MVFLKAALKPGDRAALTLQFANAGAVTVTARVTAPGADRHPMH
jgi:copper(I)-binding protein